jgi:hypothetical protein
MKAPPSTHTVKFQVFKHWELEVLYYSTPLESLSYNSGTPN